LFGLADDGSLTDKEIRVAGTNPGQHFDLFVDFYILRSVGLRRVLAVVNLMRS
jgi:hypothetical protein